MDLSQQISKAMSITHGYSIARQLGLYHWIGHKVEMGLSLGEYLIRHDEYVSGNQIFTAQIDGTLFNALLLNGDWLHERYPCDYGFAKHEILQTLCIVQVLGRSDQRIVLELDEDESIVIHEVLKTESWSAMAKTLTPDADIQSAVLSIFSDLVKRLDYINTPYIKQEQDVYVPTPTKSALLYIQQMTQILEGANKPQSNIELSSNDGDIARRLRKLGMTTDIGSIQGVYTSSKKTEWIEMPLLERAFYENRILGKAQLGDYIVCLIHRNKFDDGIGYHIVTKSKEKMWLTTTDNKADITFTTLPPEPITINEYYTSADIETLCDSYWQNSRMPAWLINLFDIVFDMKSDVDVESIQEFLNMPLLPIE